MKRENLRDSPLDITGETLCLKRGNSKKKKVKMNNRFLVPISRLTDGLLRRSVERTLEADILSFLYSTNTKLNTRHAHANEHYNPSFVQCRGWLRAYWSDLRSWACVWGAEAPPTSCCSCSQIKALYLDYHMLGVIVKYAAALIESECILSISDINFRRFI